MSNTSIELFFSSPGESAEAEKNHRAHRDDFFKRKRTRYKSLLQETSLTPNPTLILTRTR